MNGPTNKEKAELIEKLSYLDLDAHSYKHIAFILWSDDEVDYLIFDVAYYCLSTKGRFTLGNIDAHFDIRRIRTSNIVKHLTNANVLSYIQSEDADTDGLDKLLYEYLEDKKIGLSPTFLKQFASKHREEIDIIRSLREEDEYRAAYIEEKEKARKKILEKERKKAAEREAMQELIEEGFVFVARKASEKSREPIPKEVMNQVWNRDGGACVECGSKENLEFDHIIPVSKGGATTYRNLQLLCKTCNLKKSNNIG